jgi:hypothetical protein
MFGSLRVRRRPNVCGTVDNDFVDNLASFVNNFVNCVEQNNLTNMIRL